MKTLLMLICLTLTVPVANAADWLSWRKVGSATLTGALHRLHLAAADARWTLHRRKQGSGAGYYLCARHRP